jgi:hypothetical protein
MESVPECLHEEVVAKERGRGGGGCPEQSQQTPLQEVNIETRSAPMPPPSQTLTEQVVLGSSTSRGHQSLAPTSFTGHQSPTSAPKPSSSKGKPISRAITFARKGAEGIISLFI